MPCSVIAWSSLQMLKQISTGKVIAVHSPIFFFARERELAEEAFPGDIIGIPNHGALRVGEPEPAKDHKAGEACE